MGALLGVFLSLQACATTTPPGAEQTAPAPERTSTADLEALYRARQDSATLSVSDADVDFVTGMIAHHAQALVMSALAPGNGASPSIRVLAARIINAQKDEIGNMQQWLRDRSRPVPEVDEASRVHGPAAGPHVPAGAHAMPGMLTPEQTQQLAAARGRDFDRLFLTYMIQHHQGAVTMVHDLFATDGAAQDDLIFKIASDIQVDQITEIARMQQMLEALANDGGQR